MKNGKQIFSWKCNSNLYLSKSVITNSSGIVTGSSFRTSKPFFFDLGVSPFREVYTTCDLSHNRFNFLWRVFYNKLL